ncbi:asparagine synthase (glutamine-hydrolyzing) [Schlegelella sp. S2-27]|uniref:asparagine synthase (glutamine-hydrolyzing) n=1 Tax=Caldimonas mangrovi TaxID=2944811 RepID=A0ABT0YNM0_9BURK|nr:asparagine synthase (glutamine-hydrolyzing) [Caldimonas mangrovi]MCM5680334.1 asparagine synthase (glutamine-hydrolyzing) [Caldimonas mangrovi]
MCGIAGLYSLDERRSADPSIVDAMCRMIVHRGPDDQGVYVNGGAQIGMRRLSIIDLSSGHQPIHNEDRSIWIVFNGEIYNFRELRRELEALGHRFYTNTDTECIVHAYEQYGENCFQRLRGMFGIAILDLRENKLVLARDRLGKKPLYYTTTKDGLLAFASELKCLYAVPGFDPRISLEATHDYFTLGYVPAPASIYDGVHKLPPAHCLVVKQGQVSVRRYWQVEFEPKWQAPEAELKAQLSSKLEDAVRARLVSDVPFGAFLSGGIDSSVVAVLMARNLSSPVKTFTIGFKEAAFNELPDARAVAQHIGAEHHELIVEADAVSMLKDLVWYFDEPFGDSSSIPTYLVSQLAARHVKMVLSGDGGDELFAGYERYRKYQRLDTFARRAFGLGGPALRVASGLVGGARGVRMRRIADRVDQRYPDRYLSGVALNTAADLRMLLAPEVAGSDPFVRVRGLFERADIHDPMERILAGDMETYLADDILVKVDRMTMANSLEARAPLLDHELLEFAARLPLDFKLRNGVGKYLLKQVANDLLPAAVLNKRKQGFAIPVAQWFREDLRELMLDTLADRRFRERGIFNASGVQQRMADHLAGTHDYSEPLWLLLTYELWARRFVDAAAAPVAAAA